MPRGLRALLPEHDIATTMEQGWSELTNGQLLAATAAAGFRVMVTCDQSLIHQQNLTTRKLGIVLLSTNLWPVIRDNARAVANGIDGAASGEVVLVTLPRPHT